MISVVIPLYNKERSIVQTVESVLSQTYKDWELIIVDDGSTDNSLNVVRERVREIIVRNASRKELGNERVRVIHKENGGVCSARNRGIMEAKSEYIALLDADDIWDKEYLAEQAKMITDFQDAGMWGVNYADVREGKIYPYQQGVPDNHRGYINNYFGTSHADIFWTSALVLRKDVAIKVGLFDERIKYSEDMDLWYRMILNAPVCFNNHVYAYYNKDAENRAEQDVHKHYNIYQCWDYYIDKYAEDFKCHPGFARFVGMRVAINILRNNYYFGDEEDRKATDRIVKHLPLNAMPFKYTLIFKSPRWLGMMIFNCTQRLKRIKYDKF